ncbi:hypothetical protein NBRC10513_007126 [Rhodotorula toruloides]
MIAELLATLPTHDFEGYRLRGGWARLASSQETCAALAQAVTDSRDPVDALGNLVRSLMYIDYSLWTGRAATRGMPAISDWIPCIRNGVTLAFKITSDELRGAHRHGDTASYLVSQLSGESATLFAERLQRREEIVRQSRTVDLAPLASPLGHDEGVLGGRHTLEPVVDLQGNYIPPSERDGRNDIFDPRRIGRHERSLLKPELGRRAAAIYGVDRERWARLRAF